MAYEMDVGEAVETFGVRVRSAFLHCAEIVLRLPSLLLLEL